MARVNSQGYVEVSRGTTISSGRKRREWRNVFFIKWLANGRELGVVNISQIILPKKYVGKKVRFKVEVVE